MVAVQVRFANENLGWAAGSELGSLAPQAYFVETTDGGKVGVRVLARCMRACSCVHGT